MFQGHFNLQFLLQVRLNQSPRVLWVQHREGELGGLVSNTEKVIFPHKDHSEDGNPEYRQHELIEN